MHLSIYDRPICRQARWLLIYGLLIGVASQLPAQQASHPWMNPSLSPDERAAMVVKEMTLDEKITLLHGTGHPGLGPMSPLSSASNGGAGYMLWMPRMGIPPIQKSHTACSVRSIARTRRD